MFYKVSGFSQQNTSIHRGAEISMSSASVLPPHIFIGAWWWLIIKTETCCTLNTKTLSEYSCNWRVFIVQLSTLSFTTGCLTQRFSTICVWKMPISLYKNFSVSHYKTSIVLHGFFFHARGYFGVLYLPSRRTKKSAYKTTVLCEFLHAELLSQPQTFTKLRYWWAHHQAFNFLKSAARGSKVSIVGIVPSTIRGLIPGGAYIFMFSKRLWGSNSLYSKRSGTLSSEGYADHSFLSSAAVNREWSNTSTSPTPSLRGQGQLYLYNQ